ncbi:MAG: hypothetical protein ACI3XR_01355, partial [Eubacteriales bacterium]
SGKLPLPSIAFCDAILFVPFPRVKNVVFVSKQAASCRPSIAFSDAILFYFIPEGEECRFRIKTGGSAGARVSHFQVRYFFDGIQNKHRQNGT